MCDHHRPSYGVWIVASLVTVRVMQPMGRDPVNRSAFERQRAADIQKIFDQLWNSIAPVRQQTVIAHADAKALGHPRQNRGYNYTSPTPIKKRRNGAEMKNDHPYRSGPANSLMPSRVVCF